ncbi:MAG TPA: transcriptional regulator [Pseudonocardiaceae bacterium]|nr:transcriptional regulator [Pseudonocardiaceae bacterium]
MTEDWAAVSRVVTQRLTELGLSQQEVIVRSRISKTVVAEIQHNTVQRRRSARTLEALSAALAWHPRYLTAVLEGHMPPRPSEPVASGHDVPGHLASIELRLHEIANRLDDIEAIKSRLDQISADVSVIRTGRRR